MGLETSLPVSEEDRVVVGSPITLASGGNSTRGAAESGRSITPRVDLFNFRYILLLVIFAWDERNLAHIGKHGVKRLEAESVSKNQPPSALRRPSGAEEGEAAHSGRSRARRGGRVCLPHQPRSSEPEQFLLRL